MKSCVRNLPSHSPAQFLQIAALIVLLIDACLASAMATIHRRGNTTVEAKRLVTVADAIGMVRVANAGIDPLASFSPDHKRVVVVLSRGNLEQNTVDYWLLLWRTDELLNSAAPKRILTLSSSSKRPAIQNVTWLHDNNTIMFLGEKIGELQQLYRLDIEHGVLTKLTNHSTSVLSYSSTPDGSKFVFTAETQPASIFDDHALNRGYVVNARKDPISKLLFQKAGGDGTVEHVFADQHLFIGSQEASTRSIMLPGRVFYILNSPYISPDGKEVLVATIWDEAPPLWQFSAEEYFKRRYMIINLESGTSRPLLNSPIGEEGSEAAWSADSSSAVISNVYMPIDNSLSPQERQIRRSTTYPVEVQTATGLYKAVELRGSGLRLPKWDWTTGSLTFELREDVSGVFPQIRYSKLKGTWRRSEIGGTDPLPRIVLDQDLNKPPTLMVFYPGSGKSTVLLKLNPQFEEIAFSHVEEMKWKATNGHDIQGGLYYPIHYVSGQKYPLVIQTHGFNPRAFTIDGPYASSFAAQPLAARDIFVFQLDNDARNNNTLTEVLRESSKFEDIVSYLAEKGLIYPDRVGLIGFSRTCFYVQYELTHSRTRFAAASIQDGWDGGYFQYITGGAFYHVLLDAGNQYGGFEPFGEGLRVWMERSPGFNLDKVSTPIRILAQNAGAVMNEWEWFSGLSILNKPVELVLTSDDAHELIKPWNRYISLQGNVDWFDFWLNGQKDPDLAKTDQYRRWDLMRQLREAAPMTPQR